MADPLTFPFVNFPQPTKLPGEESEIQFQQDTGSARVTFFFARGASAVTPGHKEALEFAASLFDDFEDVGEIFAMCDSTGSAAINHVIGKARGRGILAALTDLGVPVGVFEGNRVEFGRAFAMDKVIGPGFDENTDDASLRCVVVYAFQSLLAQVATFTNEPVRKFGKSNPINNGN